MYWVFVCVSARVYTGTVKHRRWKLLTFGPQWAAMDAEINVHFGENYPERTDVRLDPGRG